MALHCGMFNFFCSFTLFTAFTYNAKLDAKDIASTLLLPTLTFYIKRNSSSITPSQRSIYLFFLHSTQRFQEQKRHNPASSVMYTYGQNSGLTW